MQRRHEGYQYPARSARDMTHLQPKIGPRYVFADPATDAAEGLPGCVIAQYRRCGRPNCRCASGPQHGPYFFHYWRAGGTARKRYVARLDAPRVAALCDRYRARAPSRRAVRRALRDCARLIGDLAGQAH